MTLNEARILLNKSQSFLGAEFELKILDKKSGQYINRRVRFIDTVSFDLSVTDDQPKIVLLAKLQTIDLSNEFTIDLIHLEKIIK